MPAGVGTGGTPNNPENLTGVKGYNKWVKNMKKVAQEVGFKLVNFMDKDEKVLKKQIAKDTTATLKQQKSDEKDIKDIKVEESALTKEWWDEILTEVSAKTKLFKQKLMRRGIKIRYDKTKAQKDLMTKYEFGYRYKGGDVSDLVSKLIKLLDNPKRKALGKKCREVVLENYDWQNSMVQIKNIYNELNKH